MTEERKSLQSQVRDMQPGESIVIPLGEYRMQTIYNYTSEIGLDMGRVYTTRRDRASRTIEIKRLS